MLDIKVRKVREEDLAEIARIQVDGWRAAYSGFISGEYLLALSVPEKLQKLKANYDKNGFLVAESEGRVVGFCRYVSDNSFSQGVDGVDCELTALYVEPSLKGNGVGTKLFEKVVEDFKKLGRKKMVIWCFKENWRGRSFYEKIGGEVVKEKVSVIGGQEHIEVGLVYNL